MVYQELRLNIDNNNITRKSEVLLFYGRYVKKYNNGAFDSS